MGYGGSWMDDVCSNTMLQRNCYDAYSLKNEVAFFCKQKNEHDAVKTKYIDEFVLSKLINIEEYEHLYMMHGQLSEYDMFHDLHQGNGRGRKNKNNNRRRAKTKKKKQKQNWKLK